MIMSYDFEIEVIIDEFIKAFMNIQMISHQIMKINKEYRIKNIFNEKDNKEKK